MTELMFQFPVVTSSMGGFFVSVATYYLVAYFQNINFDFGNKAKKSINVKESVTSTYLGWEGNYDNK